MCVHVFCGTFSPGCCNYALRKTAVDNASDFKVGAAETLMKNFYLDSAIQLIQDVKNICQRGGFNLTKSVPENHRKDGAKNTDVDGKLPEVSVLGICWDIERDTFKFQIDLKEKRVTQRGMLSIVSSIYDPLGFVAPFILRGKRLLQLLCQDGIC